MLEVDVTRRNIRLISIILLIEIVLINKLYKDIMCVHFFEDFIEIIYLKNVVNKDKENT